MSRRTLPEAQAADPAEFLSARPCFSFLLRVIFFHAHWCPVTVRFIVSLSYTVLLRILYDLIPILS